MRKKKRAQRINEKMRSAPHLGTIIVRGNKPTKHLFLSQARCSQLYYQQLFMAKIC